LQIPDKSTQAVGHMFFVVLIRSHAVSVLSQLLEDACLPKASSTQLTAWS